MASPVSNLRILPAEVEAPLPRPESGGEGDFFETLREAVDHAEQVQGSAESKVASLLNGSGMDVHSAMIAVEKADLSFQLMMQVRNKIVSAYQEISRMQF